MKKQAIQSVLLLLTVVFVTSCATSKLSWVKTHPASQPSLVSSDKVLQKEAVSHDKTTSTTVHENVPIVQKADAQIEVTAKSSVEKKTNIKSNALTISSNIVKYKKNVFNSMAQKAVLRHINTSSGSLSNLEPEVRYSIVLIAVGLILLLFWGFVGFGIFGLLGSLALLVGLVILILYALE